MDAASISASSLSNVQAQASIITFRKALDLQQALALQLLQSVAQVPQSSNPTATVGRHVDTFA